MYGLKLANVELNRKVLSDMAINDAEGFAKLAELGYTGPYTIEREIQEGEEKNNDIIASRDLLIQIMTDLENK